jgi:hypothetical protein
VGAALALIIIAAVGYAMGVRECMTFGGEAPTVPVYMMVFYWPACGLFLLAVALVGGLAKFRFRVGAAIFTIALTVGIALAVLLTTPTGGCTPI